MPDLLIPPEQRSTPHIIQGLSTRRPRRDCVVGIRLPRHLAVVNSDVLVLDRSICRQIHRCW